MKQFKTAPILLRCVSLFLAQMRTATTSAPTVAIRGKGDMLQTPSKDRV
jgi:hypothetical protein